MRVARVIPCLDVTNGRVVKGVNFVDLRDAGDPVELAAHYDLAGADLAGAFAEEYALWCAPDSLVYAELTSGAATFDDLHEKIADKGILPIGAVPLAGTTAG